MKSILHHGEVKGTGVIKVQTKISLVFESSSLEGNNKKNQKGKFDGDFYSGGGGQYCGWAVEETERVQNVRFIHTRLITR